MKARFLGSFGLALALILASCSSTQEPSANLTGVGPHATEASTRIVYAEDASPLGVPLAAFAEGWSRLAIEVAGLGELVEASSADGLVTYLAESPASGVSLDIVAREDVIQVAQLTAIDGVGDSDEPEVRAAIDGFLALIGAGFDGGGLDLVDGQPLFAEREVDASIPTMAVYLASNEDSILVGAIGTS